MILKYNCTICHTMYDTDAQALKCEEQPLRFDRGVKVGDLVLVIGGDGAGLRGTVESIKIMDKDWGHYAWKRYWHTIALTVKMPDWGHRLLTFDDYEVLT